MQRERKRLLIRMRREVLLHNIKRETAKMFIDKPQIPDDSPLIGTTVFENDDFRMVLDTVHDDGVVDVTVTHTEPSKSIYFVVTLQDERNENE